MSKHTVTELKKRKKEGHKFACLTAYDATHARVLSQAGLEVLLIGDSLGQVIQGRSFTLGVGLDDMVYHTQAVARGNAGSLLMADVSFARAYDLPTTVESARRLLQAGAEVIKFEVDEPMVPLLHQLSRQGVPICAHLGLRPQQVMREGGYRVKGKTQEEAKQMLALAEECQTAGANFLLLECVVAELAKQISARVQIPVIGIGAGADVDAQILVLYDMLGLHPSPPRFVKNFLAGQDSIHAAAQAYHASVLAGEFPAPEHSYR